MDITLKRSSWFVLQNFTVCHLAALKARGFIFLQGHWHTMYSKPATLVTEPTLPQIPSNKLNDGRLLECYDLCKPLK